MKKAFLLISLIFAGLFLSGCHAEYPSVVEDVKMYKIANDGGYAYDYYICWNKLSGADKYNLYLLNKESQESQTSSSTYEVIIGIKALTVSDSVNCVKYGNAYYSGDFDLGVSVSAEIDGDETYLSEIVKFKDATLVKTLPYGYTPGASF